MRRIAVVGASGSGKTWLATRLAQALANLGEPLQIDDAPHMPGSALPLGEVLLMGLDLRPPTAEQMLADQALRQRLAQQQLPFHVIYGQGEERLTHALGALKASTKAPEASTSAPATKRKPWVWSCEKCSDPVCEHRLLSDLIAKR
jgi:Mrp family chromosome partitioning ATPase